MQHHSKKMNPTPGCTDPGNYGKRKNNATIFQNCIHRTVSYIVNYRQKQALSWESNF